MILSIHSNDFRKDWDLYISLSINISEREKYENTEIILKVVDYYGDLYYHIQKMKLVMGGTNSCSFVVSDFRRVNKEEYCIMCKRIERDLLLNELGI